MDCNNNEFTSYAVGDDHPEGWGRVVVKLSSGFINEGCAMDFDWDLTSPSIHITAFKIEPMEALSRYVHFQPGDHHPIGSTRVMVKTTMGLTPCGTADEFEWDLAATKENDEQGRIIGYVLINQGINGQALTKETQDKLRPTGSDCCDPITGEKYINWINFNSIDDLKEGVLALFEVNIKDEIILQGEVKTDPSYLTGTVFKTATGKEVVIGGAFHFDWVISRYMYIEHLLPTKNME